MQKKPKLLKVLLFLLGFLSLGAFVGGIPMMLDPSGAMLKLPISMLDESPISSFLLPGIILTLFFGIIPAVIFYAFLKRPAWRWANRLNLLPDMYWGWTFTIYIGFGQIIWISVQTVIINSATLVHLFYTLIGISIISVALLTPIRTYYMRALKGSNAESQP